MLAHHGLMHDGWLILRSTVVAVDANPVHNAVARYFTSADHRHIVLRLASNYTGGTSGACIHINRQAP